MKRYAEEKLREINKRIGGYAKKIRKHQLDREHWTGI